MTQRLGALVTGAVAGVLALGTMAAPAHAQDTTHRARSTHTTTTQKHHVTTRKTQPAASARSDTSAYRSMDVRADSAVRDSSRNGAAVRDTAAIKDSASAHFNRDSAQIAPRATTTQGLPGMQGPPAGAGSPGIVTSADTTGRGANSAGGKPGGPPVTTTTPPDAVHPVTPATPADTMSATPATPASPTTQPATPATPR
jgi:hypothetical protein